MIPFDGGPPRRLAPIGERLVSVDGDGALWTAIASEDESGAAAFEVRLSPADGSPSVLLSPDLPAAFSADRAVADGVGGRLLIGTEGTASDARLAAFAVDPGGRARRLPCPPTPASPLVLSATLAAGALQIEVLYAANEPPSLVTVARHGAIAAPSTNRVAGDPNRGRGRHCGDTMAPRSPTILRLLAPAVFVAALAVAAGCVKSEGTGVDTGAAGSTGGSSSMAGTGGATSGAGTNGAAGTGGTTASAGTGGGAAGTSGGAGTGGATPGRGGTTGTGGAAGAAGNSGGAGTGGATGAAR